MPRSLVLAGVAAFIFVLFFRDLRGRDQKSAALWIPLLWLFIISTKPISLWFGSPEAEIAGYPEDKLLDKILFLFLIAAGLVVLSKRRVDWREIFRNNKWLFAYFLYLGASVLWSDESFVSFKRWIKDAGNIVMVLVVLSEKEPVEAARAFLARFTCAIIPLSVVSIKYFPELSRHYDSWTNQPVFVGLTTDKNTFGMTLFVCGLSRVWLLLEFLDKKEFVPKRRLKLLGHLLLLLMTAWMLSKAHSATAMSCTVLGAGLLFGARTQVFKRRVQKLEAWVAATVCVILLFQISGVGKVILKEFSEAVGRDAKLHGRSEIWGGVLKEEINPLLGTGFYSFWSPERNERISKDLGFYYELGTAHNGYIETYLNSGILGLALLLALLASALKGIKSQVLTGSGLGPLRLAFLVDVIVYNVTESAFDRLVPLWFALLLIVVEYPSFGRSVAESHEGGDSSDSVFASTRNEFSVHQVAATALA